MVNITFGLLDGALNAMPRGGLLYECGKFNKEQRIHYVNSVTAYEQRNIKDMVKNFYEAMKLQYKVTYYCWYGIKKYLGGQYLIDLIIKFKVIEVILFNLGYMWTDFVMLALGRPGQTESDFAYYVAFYIGDFFFRFIFKQEGDGNCWYEWITCTSDVNLTINNAV